MNDVCYRVDDGLVLAIKSADSYWSPIERGSTGVLSVITVSVLEDTMDEWRSGTYAVDDTSYKNKLYVIDGEVIVAIEEIGGF